MAQSGGDKLTLSPEPVAGKEVSHWSGLPVWGKEEAEQRGFELPLPLGVSGSYYAEEQDFRMPELKLGPEGGRLRNIGSLVRVADVKTAQSARTVRLDAWVLPFLNVYALVGNVEGHADVGAEPGFLPHACSPRLKIKLEYDGPTVGLGSTLATGFKPFKNRPTIVFGLADLNVTETFLDFRQLVTSLEPVTVVVLNLRLGVRERILQNSSLGDWYVSLWGGGMCEGVQEVMKGGLGTFGLDFQGNVKAFNPWNTIVGGRVEIGKHFDVTIDVGVGERKSLMLAGTFRF